MPEPASFSLRLDDNGRDHVIFYRLAELNGDLPQGSDEDQRLSFWANEVKAIHGYYRRPHRR